MFKNIGKKIKGLAKVLFWLLAICSVVIGLYLLDDTDGISAAIGVGGVLVAWIGSWFLYGFGEIIDKLCEIERYTRIEKQPEVKPEAAE